VDEDVAFPGFVDDPFPYMKGAGLFVLSSRWEGLPNVLIQALAVGAPAVATDCPSGPREILDGGRYGRLAPVDDEAALARAMEEELDHRSERPGEDWRRRYALAAVTDAYLEVLDGTAPSVSAEGGR
jgi:glycosyltransferase involved in cell wall biosynthesis